jgi:hypothetical protein
MVLDPATREPFNPARAGDEREHYARAGERTVRQMRMPSVPADAPDWFRTNYTEMATVADEEESELIRKIDEQLKNHQIPENIPFRTNTHSRRGAATSRIVSTEYDEQQRASMRNNCGTAASKENARLGVPLRGLRKATDENNKVPRTGEEIVEMMLKRNKSLRPTITNMSTVG